MAIFSRIVFCFFLFSAFVVNGQSSPKIDSLKTEAAQTKSDSSKVLLNISISREMQRQKVKRDTFLSYAEKAVDMALETKDTLLYARALDNLGLLYRFNQKYKEALPLHTRAFELVENKENVPPIFKMIFADNAGLAARYDQSYDLAISFYMKALPMAEAEGNLKNIAIATNGIGNALLNLPEREEEAINFFKRSLEAETKRGNTLGMAMNYLSISDYYISRKNFKVAREYLDKLLAINKERNDRFGLAITYEFMGIAYMEEEQRLQKAIFYFNNALSRFEDLNNDHKRAEIYSNLGKTEFKRGKIEKAKDYYWLALDLAYELDRFDLMDKNSLALSQIAESEGNFNDALAYYKQSEAFKDSIDIAEQNLTIEALIKEYDLAEKENYIQLLEKDQALQKTLLKNQEEQLKRRRLYLIFLIVGIVLLGVIFLLQYRNYIAKKEAQLRFVEEEKAKTNAVYERNLARAETIANRLRINPHFLFNSLNAITYLVQSEQNEEAIKYLTVFSRYTRLLLETSTKQVIPLQEELDLARYYMLLEENRFEKDFEFNIHGDMNPELDMIKIPPLLLQPFLENAVWHGLLPKDNEGPRILEIFIIPEEDEGLQIIIEDNGVGRSSKPTNNKNRHKSMGIPITNERIDLFNKSYPENISYEIIDKFDEYDKPTGTKVVFDIQFDLTDGEDGTAKEQFDFP